MLPAACLVFCSDCLDLGGGFDAGGARVAVGGEHLAAVSMWQAGIQLGVAGGRWNLTGGYRNPAGERGGSGLGVVGGGEGGQSC